MMLMLEGIEPTIREGEMMGIEDIIMIIGIEGHRGWRLITTIVKLEARKIKRNIQRINFPLKPKKTKAKNISWVSQKARKYTKKSQMINPSQMKRINR